MAQDHHDRTVRVHLLRHPEVVNAVIGDDICQVVLWNRYTLFMKLSACDRGSEGADVEDVIVLGQTQM